MKKVIALLLAVVILMTVLPMSVAAFGPYKVHAPQSGCQLKSFSFEKAVNSWLMWDLDFDAKCAGRALVSQKAHPNILGQAAVPTFTFEGDRVTFNGTDITSDVTAVTLKAENDVVVYAGSTKAEYQVNIDEETNGIPVVLIDTNGVGIPDKVNYVDTAITILGAEVYGGEDLYAVTGGIKLRGNSTSAYDKKPYRIKFDKKQNVFGLGKAKSWVLLANYLDPAGMRNDIAYGFASRMSEMVAKTSGFEVYVPRVRPVEVYLNGEYRGLYDMGDHVQVDSTRIAIDESGDEFDDNDVQLFPEGNVGYYLEIEHPTRVIPEWYSENAYYVTIKNSGGTGTDTIYTGGLNDDGTLETAGTGKANTLYVQIKTPEIPSSEQVTYIRNYLQKVNDLILAKDSRVFDYIDMDGFIDWYLTNELFKNTDSAFLSSIKMFKDKDGKLYMGPVWDFDIGSGAVAYNGVDDPKGWLTRADTYCGWYKALFSMPQFARAVEARWAELHENGILEQITADIDGLSRYLDKALRDNFAMWHSNYVNDVYNTGWLTVPDLCLTGEYDAQWRYLRNYMQGRIAWMDEQFGYSTVSTTKIGGNVSIIGTSEVEQTLLAGTYNVQPQGASLSYQWYRDGAAISGARSSSYTLTESDIGHAVSVSVTARSYSGMLTSESLTVTKTYNDYVTSQIPPIESYTADTIVVTERTGYEITVDGVNWQMSGTFTGLEPNTLYAVRYRHTSLGNQQVGQPGKAVYVITDAAPYPVGDINLDGEIGMKDAMLLYSHVSGVRLLDDPSIGDYNADTIVNMRDVMLLYQFVSGAA